MTESDDLIREFLIESHEGLDRLDQDLVDLEKAPRNRETLGSVFRAIAPLASSAPLTFSTMPCKGEHVAAWLAHGTADFAIPVEGGLATKDFWRIANHCAATSQPANPAGCVAYDGCDPGYPVHWCAFDGGHEFPSFATQAIWSFFSQF